ncbi:MAG: GNAT family N-acetyltransferase [Cyanobacteria bacterium SZAS-4]|nr:GNAT family N-acetyltransferase [Cyanobacteria bacterium SZAS-4]
MDHILYLGSLAMSSRLKRLSEKFFQDVHEIYNMFDFDFEPKWFPVFHLLHTDGKDSIGEIATKLGITHAAVNLTVNELEKKGLVVSTPDKRDGRKRLVSLSAKGKKLAADLEPLWEHIRAAVDDLISDAGGNFLKEVETIETKFALKSVKERMLAMKSTQLQRAQIVDYAPEYREDFLRLNRAWIEKFFKVEAADLRILENPESEIIAPGGAVLFAKIDGKVVGTLAILNLGNHEFELAKMSVDETYQGRGIGLDLVQACINEAKNRGAKAITLETNSVLAPAISLYKKCGFVEVKSLAHETEYERANYFMRLDLLDDPLPESR